MKIAFDKNLINHGFFEHIPDGEKAQIARRLEFGSSQCAIFSERGKDLFGVVYDFDGATLTLAWVCGNFSRCAQTLHDCSEALALAIGAEYLSFYTVRRAVAKLSQKYGFREENAWFEKRVGGC